VFCVLEGGDAKNEPRGHVLVVMEEVAFDEDVSNPVDKH
jgi:hypothetical protein